MHPAENSHHPAPSSDQRIVGAIPARYASFRLPGKPLRELAGRPLIEHVYERTSEASELDHVVVLTDDERIVEAVAGFGGNCELTPQSCASGTDRIAWAARSWQASAVVNIQGDEPLIEPGAIDLVAAHLRDQQDDPMVTLAAAAAAGEPENPDVVKVVVDRQGYALYFSRAAIPYARGPEPKPPWRHVGIYGYQLETLFRLAEIDPTPLEKSESLEQLRALENGIRIRVLEIERAWRGVDTMEDLEKLEKLLKEGRPIRR